MRDGAAMTVAQVAAHWGVTPKAVYGWIKAGKVPARKLPGGDYRFLPEDVASIGCRVGDSIPQTIGSGSGATGITSPGRTPRLAARGPFQRGRASAVRPKSGVING